jgi:hypothetical protein
MKGDSVGYVARELKDAFPLPVRATAAAAAAACCGAVRCCVAALTLVRMSGAAQSLRKHLQHRL